METPKEATEPKSKIELELEKIEEQKAKLLDGLKIELSKLLAKAADQYKLLQKLGVNNVLTEPMFFEQCQVLNINQAVEQPTAEPKAKRGKKTDGSKSVADCILEALQGGEPMMNGILQKNANLIYGSKILDGSFNGALMKLKKEKKIMSPKRAFYKLA